VTAQRQARHRLAQHRRHRHSGGSCFRRNLSLNLPRLAGGGGCGARRGWRPRWSSARP
jgi:hypothetical protein